MPSSKRNSGTSIDNDTRMEKDDHDIKDSVLEMDEKDFHLSLHFESGYFRCKFSRICYN